MNIDEIIAVLQAYKKGKKIQVKSVTDDFWFDYPNPQWNFAYHTYRIAPEEQRKPREYWVDSNASNGPWSCWNYVPSYPSGSLEQRCLVHVREVDDEATPKEPKGVSDTAKTFHEPREWEVVEIGEGSITSSSGFEPESEVIRVREVLE